MNASTRLADPVIWSDVENGAYVADLPVWEELAPTDAPILELGCGSGRVALHLGRRGRAVVAVDLVPELVAAVAERARSEGVRVEAAVADIRALDLGRRFAAVIAPMQVVQLLADPADRAAMLRGVSDHLAPGGRAGFALLDEQATREGAFEAQPGELVPDVREADGWVHSSLPLAVSASGEGLAVHRLRQVVSPGGEMVEAEDVVRLTHLDPAAFEAEALAAGLIPAGRREIAPTEDHLGSTVVILKAPTLDDA